MFKKNDELKAVKIIDYTHEGLGVAKVDNIPIFIKYGKLDSIVDVKITKVEKKFAYGLITSSNELEYKCPHFKQCGGCQIMHLTYDEQLVFKKRVVDNLVNKFSITATVDDVVENPNQFEYRNKVQMPFSFNGNRIFLGLYKERSHDVVDIKHCYLQSPVVNEIVLEVEKLMNEVKETVYNEDKHRGNLRHLYIREATNTGQIMVCFVVNSDRIKGQKEVVKKLKKKFPMISSMVVNENQRKTNAVLGFKNHNIYNTNYITEKLGEIEYQIQPNAFFQVNTKQAEQMYQKVVEYAELTKEDRVLDAYCGTGSISLFLAKYAKSVVGIEIVVPAIASANKNKKLNSIDNVKFICNDIEKEIVDYKDSFFDVVVVDPPRKGLEENFIEALKKFKPKRIVYVSCNPATLMRDLKLLEELYTIDAITPFDMFSQTYHVESVVKLTLK